MSHSLARIHVHLVFSTKRREMWIQDAVREALHRFMSGVLDKLDCPAVIINSVEDHVHVLFKLGRNVTLAKVVEDLKSASSKWFKTLEGVSAKFGWQNGYGAFAVSETNVDAVRRYILKQREHHKKRNFQMEYRTLLLQNGIALDDDHLWD
ncbi:MAG TPA: IS200/IS605 family transposase [Polyangiaceae bacterium]|nr:IS200/IS605 family transposase [Polyangiaceae bacterium]